MKNKKNLFVVVAAAVFVFGFSVFGIIAPDKEISVSERRPLAKFPQISAEKIFDGSFAGNFEKYSLDQFPLRDGFRTLKAFTSKNILRQKDNNGLYYADGHLSKLDFPVNLDSVKRATNRFNEIIKEYADKNARVFFSVIPDKNYFLAEKNGYPAMDYEKLISFAKNSMKTSEYIDIIDLLEISDYYKTDSHWRQECITDVAKRIAEKTGTVLNEKYTEKKLGSNFFGVYAGQSALPVPSESITCLETDETKKSTVYDAETNGFIPVYNLEKLKEPDQYETFLSGSKSLLKIKNPNGPKGKKLVVFRDSFSSSLAPLLISGYSELTLIDIRYISPKLLKNFVDFSGCDILFLYSTGILNNSVTIK